MLLTPCLTLPGAMIPTPRLSSRKPERPSSNACECLRLCYPPMALKQKPFTWQCTYCGPTSRADWCACAASALGTYCVHGQRPSRMISMIGYASLWGIPFEGPHPLLALHSPLAQSGLGIPHPQQEAALHHLQAMWPLIDELSPAEQERSRHVWVHWRRWNS